MIDLDSRARAIVEAARDADNPTPSDRDRIKRAVLVQLAAGAVATTAAASTMTVGMKVGLAVLAVSLVGGGTAGVWKLRASHDAAGVATRAPMRKVAVQGGTAAPVEIPVMVEPAASAPVENRARRGDKSRKLAGPGARESERLADEDQLNAEVAVLKRAREELRLGRPAQALEALLEYDRRFGKGVLGEERQAMAAIAACQARPGPSARAQAQAFVLSSPKSPLLERVRAACITPTPTGSP
jgi:hypothetical protein